MEMEKSNSTRKVASKKYFVTKETRFNDYVSQPRVTLSKQLNHDKPH